jgi:ceroid-lipofuscinosis MFS transporter 7
MKRIDFDKHFEAADKNHDEKDLVPMLEPKNGDTAHTKASDEEDNESMSSRKCTACCSKKEGPSSSSTSSPPSKSKKPKQSPAANTATSSSPVSQKMPRSLRVNIACMCFFAFLTGTDFAVIIPTLWDRLSQDFNSSGTFMGLVMSAYSLSGVICGLIMGKFSDEVNRTKPFYTIAIVFSVLGHILYFVGINKYVLLASRAISGIGLGCSTIVIAYIARTTTDKQRTAVISLVMASRQIGLMFGPAFNVFLRKLNFMLFNTFLVDRKSAPGLFMAFAWVSKIIFFLLNHD